MTEERLVLAELLEKAGEGDFLRAVAEAVLQLLMESDVEGMIGAGRYERSGERTTWRNGYRDRTLDTRLGALQLLQAASKSATGSYTQAKRQRRRNTQRSDSAVNGISSPRSCRLPRIRLVRPNAHVVHLGDIPTGCRNPTIAIADGAACALREGAADMDRRVWFLHRFGPGDHRVEMDELAMVFGLGFRPDFFTASMDSRIRLKRV